MGSRSAVLTFARAFVVAAAVIAWIPAAQAGPIVALTWYQFAFGVEGEAATGCDPADPAGPFCIESSGTSTTFLDAPPWTFTAPAGGAMLVVVDAFLSGDQFEIFDFGVSLGLTSAPTPDVDCGDDPVVCLATPGMSTGAFLLAAGPHSISIVVAAAPDGGGSGYLQVSAASVAEPASLGLLLLGLLVAPLARRRLAR